MMTLFVRLLCPVDHICVVEPLFTFLSAKKASATFCKLTQRSTDTLSQVEERMRKMRGKKGRKCGTKNERTKNEKGQTLLLLLLCKSLCSHNIS